MRFTDENVAAVDSSTGQVARALEEAVDRGRLAPSVHNTQPWTFVLFPDRLELRADRSRQLTVLDPLGRELALSVGAALFNIRAALAVRRFAVDVTRLASPEDPDLLAVVRPVEGEPDANLAALDRVAHRRHTNRRPFERASVPDEVVDRLVEVAAAEDARLVPVRDPAQRSLIAELTQEADRLQATDPAYRAELEYWTSRPPDQGDGVPASSVPRSPRSRRDAVPLRDFDPGGTGGLAARTGSGTDQTMVLVATPHDGPLDWLRSGEALERLLLELTRGDFVAGPVTQALEVPSTRERLRRLSMPDHPQMLLRIGRAAPIGSTGRRPRRTVVVNSTRSTPPPPEPHTPVQPPPTTTEQGHRPISDGRGGTTWV